MSDLVDVENTLVNLLTSAIYPNGVLQPSVATVGSAAGAQSTLPFPVPVKIFRGWPTPQQQEAAKFNNFVNVSVSAPMGNERNVSRYPILPVTLTGPTKTLTAVVNPLNNQVTIGGTVSTPQNIILLIGPFNQVAYAVQPTDTLSTIATGLAAAVNAVFPGMASATGPVVTLVTGRVVIARVAGAGTVLTETKRQERMFQICIWAPPCPTLGFDADSWRYAVAQLVEPIFGGFIRIALPDQTWAHIFYNSSYEFDVAQQEGLYRRDLRYMVEYATTITSQAFEIGAMQTQQTGAFTPDGTLATFPTAPPPVGPPTVDVES